MKSSLFGAAAMVVIGASSLIAGATPAAAENERLEVTLHRLHDACDAGDRHACVRFGVIIGENRERHEEWRRSHPEFFGWWER